MSKLSKLMKETDKLLSKSEVENLSNICIYIRSSKLREKKENEIIYDIYSIVGEGISKGKTLDEIIGSDYKSFADDVIKSINSKKTNSDIYLGVLLGSIFLLRDV